MNAQAFTPGPWWLHAEHSTLYVEGVAKDPRVTQEVAAVGPKEGGREQQLADARLIAAAPELYELIAALLATRHRHFIDNECALEMLGWDERARAALAKARGDA